MTRIDYPALDETLHQEILPNGRTGCVVPRRGLATRLAELAQETRTVAVYESPHRLPRTLQKLSEAFGADRNAAVCREISKIHETVHSGTLGELAEYFAMNQPKGEIVIVIEGRKAKARTDAAADKTVAPL